MSGPSTGLPACTTMLPVLGLISKPATCSPALIADLIARTRSVSLKLRGLRVTSLEKRIGELVMSITLPKNRQGARCQGCEQWGGITSSKVSGT